MPENLSTLLRSTEPTVLTTGWGRTEGPVWLAEGFVTFVQAELSPQRLGVLDLGHAQRIRAVSAHLSARKASVASQNAKAN